VERLTLTADPAGTPGVLANSGYDSLPEIGKGDLSASPQRTALRRDRRMRCRRLVWENRRLTSSYLIL